MFLVSNEKKIYIPGWFVSAISDCLRFRKGQGLAFGNKLKEQHWNKTWKVCGWILMNPVIAMLLAGQVDSDLFSSYGSNHHFLRLFFRHRKHANSPAAVYQVIYFWVVLPLGKSWHLHHMKTFGDHFLRKAFPDSPCLLIFCCNMAAPALDPAVSNSSHIKTYDSLEDSYLKLFAVCIKRHQVKIHVKLFHFNDIPPREIDLLKDSWLQPTK